MLGERITGHLIWGYSDLLGCAGGEKQGALWFQSCPGESRPTGRPSTAGNQGYFPLAFCSATAASTTLATQTSQDQGPTSQEATRLLSCCWAPTGRLLVTGGLPHGWPLRLQKHWEFMRQSTVHTHQDDYYPLKKKKKNTETKKQ